jgi:PemK-like, MazF-like toxin of type II toxin-antitoxin system
MPIGTPRIGQVIHYSFLWSDGKEKERPAVIVVATKRGDNDKYRVAVMPITHTPHSDPATSIEIPQKLKDYLKLDHEKSWVVLNEINTFEWPGYDLRKVPDGRTDWEYGQIPPRFHEILLARLRVLRQDNRLTLTSRDQ